MTTPGIFLVGAIDANTGLKVQTKWWQDGNGNLSQITTEDTELASGTSPVSGSFNNSGLTSNPFTPISGRGFNVSLWSTGGPFLGTVTLNRSFDGGTTLLPMATYTGSISEIRVEPEANVEYTLTSVTFSAGPSIQYRMSQ